MGPIEGNIYTHRNRSIYPLCRDDKPLSFYMVSKPAIDSRSIFVAYRLSPHLDIRAMGSGRECMVYLHIN